MNIIITGGKGMLGRTLQKYLIGHNVYILDLPKYSILDKSSMLPLFKEAQPDLVIHCAAMTNVDKCETEQDLAYNLNVIGTQNIAELCKNYNCRLFAISTDYVFNGKSQIPYKETDLAGNAETVYGQTKYLAEEKVKSISDNYLILRISWLYGNTGPSFVHTMLKLAENNTEIKVVSDQHGNPTSTDAVAEKILELINRPDLKNFIIHCTCEGDTTWYEFAKEIFKQANINVNVIPCDSNTYVRPAKRPKNSCLEKFMIKQLNLKDMPNWKNSLKNFLINLDESDKNA